MSQKSNKMNLKKASKVTPKKQTTQKKVARVSRPRGKSAKSSSKTEVGKLLMGPGQIFRDSKPSSKSLVNPKQLLFGKTGKEEIEPEDYLSSTGHITQTAHEIVHENSWNDYRNSEFGSEPASYDVILRNEQEQKMINVQNTEFLGSYTTSATALTEEVDVRLQPGSSSFMPWGFALAQRYEKYRWVKDSKRPSFTVHITTDAPTTATGRIYVVLDTDMVDSDPTSADEIMAGYNAASFQVWRDANIGWMGEDLMWQNWYFTRPDKYGENADLFTTDPRLYDSGRLRIFVQNFSASFNIQVMISYNLDLYLPQPVPDLDGPLPPAPVAEYGRTGTTNYPTTLANLVLGTVVNYANLGITADGIGNFVLPRGTYLLDGLIKFANSAVGSVTASAGVYKNGSLIQAAAYETKENSVDYPAGDLNVTQIIDSDGTDSFSIRGTSTASAGTLALSASSVVRFILLQAFS
jgi:hypothetical protein